MTTRRRFLQAAAATTGALATGPAAELLAAAATPPAFGLGLVTYNWGKDWDLPTLLKNCADAGFAGVELRSTHAHGVEPSLPPARRSEVAAIFASSPVTLVGLGSACEYHSSDAAELKKNIEDTRAFIELCHDIGGYGVKVRPNGLPEGVPAEKTIAQIGKGLNEVAEHAYGFGVEIRVEVHGRGTSEIPAFAKIMEVADHPNVFVCWNCNETDLVTVPGVPAEKALEDNYGLFKDRISTVHIHDLRSGAYPWKKLFELLKRDDFTGWTLLEDGKVPGDEAAIVAAMAENRARWEEFCR